MYAHQQTLARLPTSQHLSAHVYMSISSPFHGLPTAQPTQCWFAIIWHPASCLSALRGLLPAPANRLSALQLAELRFKLTELRSTASADHLAKADLESRQHRLHDDTSRLEKRLAAVEADRESLSLQLKVIVLAVSSTVF